MILAETALPAYSRKVSDSKVQIATLSLLLLDEGPCLVQGGEVNVCNGQTHRRKQGKKKMWVFSHEG